MIHLARKRDLINSFQKHENDTGSMEVQIAVLTERIKELNDHLRTNKKDYSTKRGLMSMVTRRRCYLDYLKRTDVPAYRSMVDRLGLRK